MKKIFLIFLAVNGVVILLVSLFVVHRQWPQNSSTQPSWEVGTRPRRLTATFTWEFRESRVLRDINVFFLETTGSAKLNARQACAVESAARNHVSRDIHVLFLSQNITDTVFSDQIMKTLVLIPNVKLAYINIVQFFSDTVLQQWLYSKVWDDSFYSALHLSNALRYLILWKLGGIYFDLDVIVLKSLDSLSNCVGLQSADIANTAVLKFTQEDKFLNRLLHDLPAAFVANHSGDIGSQLVTRTLETMCNVELLKELQYKECRDAPELLPPEAFYPISSEKSWMLFDETRLNLVQEQIKNSYVVHTWNMHTRGTSLAKESPQAYARLAQDHCPLVAGTAQGVSTAA